MTWHNTETGCKTVEDFLIIFSYNFPGVLWFEGVLLKLLVKNVLYVVWNEVPKTMVFSSYWSQLFSRCGLIRKYLSLTILKGLEATVGVGISMHMSEREWGVEVLKEQERERNERGVLCDSICGGSVSFGVGVMLHVYLCLSLLPSPSASTIYLCLHSLRNLRQAQVCLSAFSIKGTSWKLTPTNYKHSQNLIDKRKSIMYLSADLIWRSCVKQHIISKSKHYLK